MVNTECERFVFCNVFSVLLLSVSSCSKLQQPSKSSRSFNEMFAASPSAQSPTASPDWAFNQVYYKTNIFLHKVVNIPLFHRQ